MTACVTGGNDRYPDIIIGEQQPAAEHEIAAPRQVSGAEIDMVLDRNLPSHPVLRHIVSLDVKIAGAGVRPFVILALPIHLADPQRYCSLAPGPERSVSPFPAISGRRQMVPPRKDDRLR
jgi:hypothetical protein